MKRNESTLDRIIRVIIGIAALAVSFVVVGPLKIVLIVVAVIALFTAVTGFCLLYKLFGIATLKEKAK
jgi:hypothetical protein